MNASNLLIHSSSHGKMILFGEYLALRGYSSVGIPIPQLTMNASYEKGEEDTLTIMPYHESHTPMYDHIAHICDHYHVPPLKGTITLQSTIPISSGLGSSAALSVCVAKIILSLYPHIASSQKHSINIWNIAHNIEALFHENPSGIDTALCIYDTPLLIEKAPFHINTPSQFQVQPITLPIQPHLIYTEIKRTLSTKKSILTLHNTLMGEEDPRLHQWIYHHNQAIQEITHFTLTKTRDCKELLSTLIPLSTKIHEIMRSYTLSHPKIEQMRLFAQAISSTHKRHVGGKISGAGNGGAYFFLCENNTYTRKLISLLQKKYSDLTFHTL